MNRSLQTASALVAVLITVAILWLGNRPAIPKKSSWQDVIQEAQSGGYRLIGVKELWKRYQQSSPDLLLVDTRQEWEYRTGHIKDAVNFPMEPTWWSRWSNKSELNRFLGPDKSKFIVFF